MPEAALNLAGFNEDDAENIYENRRRFLKLFDGDWTLTGCWQIHSADVRIVHNQQEAQQNPACSATTNTATRWSAILRKFCWPSRPRTACPC